MDTYIEFQRYQDLSSATELIDILDENEIPYQVDDSSAHFDLTASSISPLDQHVIIKIREEDFEKVNGLFTTDKKQPINNSSDDHYLYSFSDNDIIDVIVNPEEWTDFEVTLAKQISKQRGLKPTAEFVKSTRKEKIEEEKKEAIMTKTSISMGYAWFLWIAILSIINTIDFTYHKRLFFIFGLGITQVVDGAMKILKGNFVIAGFVFNIIISFLFFVFWYYAKKKKQWAFIVGLVLYGLDTILFILVRDWLSTGFHIFVLLGIGFGYQSLLQNNKKTVA